MREIKFIYTVVRENGFIFSSTPFDIRDIELGSSEQWLEINHAGDISKVLHRRQYTGLNDKNEISICIYEGDILSLDGKVIGNKYENRDLLKDKTNIIIEGLGTSNWRYAEKAALGRGCFYSE